MFSLFKSKVSDPLANKHNVEYIDSISKLAAINSVKRVVTLEEGLLFFDENFVETIISYDDSEKTMRLRNAAFEYWFFSLRVLFYCLEEIANEYDDGNQEIFLIPVYVKIIQTSKEYLKAEIANKLWDTDNYDYGEEFDSLMKNKLSELLLKPVMPITLDIKPLSEKNSALDLTIYNAINALGAEVIDPVYQLRLITNQMDATKDFRDICKDVFKDMRRLMKR